MGRRATSYIATAPITIACRLCPWPAAEEISQIVLEVGEPDAVGIAIAGIGCGPVSVRAALPGPAAAWIREHRIGLIQPFEALLGARIVVIEIRMPAAGLLTEGPLELFRFGAGLHAQHLPVVGASQG